MVALKRVYEPASRTDGRRVLVERLWPRGLRKDALALDEWAKEVAPSGELRRWFGHDPSRWEEFRRRYRAELAKGPAREKLEELAAWARRQRLTLLFSSRELEHNNAVALADEIERIARDRPAPPASGRPKR